MKSLIVLALVLFSIINISNAIDENSFFQNKVVLKENFYDLHWNFTSTDVTFKIVVKKQDGWVGFGLSPNGEMYQSYLVMAHFKPSATLKGYHVGVNAGAGSHRPIPDTKENWEKLFMKKDNDEMVVIFRRKIKIVESETNGFNDEILKSQEVIFAWGDNFDNDNTPIYHGTAARDNKLVNILQTNNANKLSFGSFSILLTLLGLFIAN